MLKGPTTQRELAFSLKKAFIYGKYIYKINGFSLGIQFCGMSMAIWFKPVW